MKCTFSWDLQRVILKIRCPQWRLEEVAEHMHLKLKTRDGTFKRFKVSRRDNFIPVGASSTLFKSSERYTSPNNTTITNNNNNTTTTTTTTIIIIITTTTTTTIINNTDINHHLDNVSLISSPAVRSRMEVLS